MKDEFKIKGNSKFLYRTIEKGDIPKNSLLKSLICSIVSHEWSKELGGIGTFINIEKDRTNYNGDTGCFFKYCRRCGGIKYVNINTDNYASV